MVCDVSNVGRRRVGVEVFLVVKLVVLVTRSEHEEEGESSSSASFAGTAEGAPEPQRITPVMFDVAMELLFAGGALLLALVLLLPMLLAE